MPKTIKPKIIEKPTDIVESKNEIQDSGFEMLIAKAIDKDTSVEVMEKLLAMRKEFLAEQAKKAFDEAMAKFQKECPVIEKTKPVYEKGSTTAIRYKYAVLDSIVSQTKNAIASNGLSYSFDELKDEKFTTIICTVTHIAGHSRQTSFKIPIGTEAYMSDVQKHGARMTFGKRYAFCNAFGIITGDEDNDAQDTGKSSSQQTQPAQPTYHPDPQTPAKVYHCIRHWSQTKEKVQITEAEANYSKKNYGFELCLPCQKVASNAPSTAKAPKQADKPISEAQQEAKDLAEVNSWDKTPATVDAEETKLNENIEKAKGMGK